jgi:hypothetical protein
MISAYTLRKVANQDSIRRLNAAAYDVTGLESQRLHSSTIVDDLLRASGTDPKDLGFMFTSAGATTDRITSMAISASELQKPRGVTERARALFSKREAIANPNLTMAFEELEQGHDAWTQWCQPCGIRHQAGRFGGATQGIPSPRTSRDVWRRGNRHDR